MKLKKNRAIKKLLKDFGSIPKLAKFLGINAAAIHQWNKFPVGRAYQLEVMTNGKYLADELLKE